MKIYILVNYMGKSRTVHYFNITIYYPTLMHHIVYIKSHIGY